MRVKCSTLLSILLALIFVWLAVFDPWMESDKQRVSFVSSSSSTRRVFPELAERELDSATFEFQGTNGPLLRLVPGPLGGHLVMLNDEFLGPADPEAIEGAWASLRMATTLRAVARGTDIGAGQRGTLRIAYPDYSTTLELGRDAPDASGVYGRIKENSSTLWVIERELAWLVEQEPQSWVSRSLTEFDVDSIVQVSWVGHEQISRGKDSLWRYQGRGEEYVLSTAAVRAKLGRLLPAHFRQVIRRGDIAASSLRPWLTLTPSDGSSQHFMLGGVCPNDPNLVVVDRGSGVLGCIEAGIAQPWPWADKKGGLFESQVVPYVYGQVHEVVQSHPEFVRLVRRGGGWATTLARDQSSYENVVESEVYRWFQIVRTLRFEAATTQLDEPQQLKPQITPQFAWSFISDTRDEIKIACGEWKSQRFCTRNGTPYQAVWGQIGPNPVLNKETFVDRQLLQLSDGDVIAVEIMGDDTVVRQSVHLDYGEWRLDAPEHPNGNGALDQTRLESLFSRISNLRAEAWVDGRDEVPIRTLEIQLVPKDRRETIIRIALYRQCVVRINRGRWASLSKQVCSDLQQDVMYTDPIRFMLRDALRMEWRRSGEIDSTRLLKSDHKWRNSNGDVLAEDLKKEIERWNRWRSFGIASGLPHSRTHDTLNIHRKDGHNVSLLVGEDWVGFHGLDWHYKMDTNKTEPQ